MQKAITVITWEKKHWSHVWGSSKEIKGISSMLQMCHYMGTVRPPRYTPDHTDYLPAIYTQTSLCWQSQYLCFSSAFIALSDSVASVWTFETNGHGQQSRDNPSRLCKYKSACFELNVNALIWNANCVLCDMSKHWRAALWDGKLKASSLPVLIPADLLMMAIAGGCLLFKFKEQLFVMLVFVLALLKWWFCIKSLKEFGWKTRNKWSSQIIPGFDAEGLFQICLCIRWHNTITQAG